MMSPGLSAGLLSGVRVIDLTSMLSGPYCTMMLADQGADVLKIESWEGDTTRIVGPFLRNGGERIVGDGQLGGYFQSVNRNKKGMVLNLRRPEATEIVLRLAAEAHVIVNNFRPGVMERLNLSYERVRAVNPRIIYASLNGFGDPALGESPYKGWPAYDVIAQAMGGVMGLTGPNAGAPTKVGPGIGDIIPGALLAFGTVAAIRHAERTGEGQRVDIAMYDAMVSVCERAIYQYTFGGYVAEPEGNTHPFFAPFGIYPATDGWVTIAAQNTNFWRVLTDIMGRPELADDPRFIDKTMRGRNRRDINAIVAEWTARYSKTELTVMLGGKVPYGPVQTAKEIVEDPHLVARQMLVEVEEPGVPQPMRIVGTPVKFSVTPGGVRHRSPHLGEHTDVELSQLGYAPERIADLRRSQVIK